MNLRVAVYQKLSFQMDHWLILKENLIVCQWISYQLMLTGEIWMDVIICHGIKTNIFLDIVDHAGLKELQVPLLIDSTYWMVFSPQRQLVWTLRLLLTAKQVVAATVVTPHLFTNMHLTKVSQIARVSSTLLITLLIVSVPTMTCAGIASHQYPR